MDPVDLLRGRSPGKDQTWGWPSHGVDTATVQSSLVNVECADISRCCCQQETHRADDLVGEDRLLASVLTAFWDATFDRRAADRGHPG